MDTTALQIFVEVVKRGSFAAVARDRHVDPSIVSRAIKGLEDELGSRLFQRTTRRLSLTEAGVAFFDRITPAVEKIERARESVAEAGRIPRGTLRVTTSVSFGERQLVPLLPKFRALYPELMIDLVLTETSRTLSPSGSTWRFGSGNSAIPASLPNAFSTPSTASAPVRNTLPDIRR